MFLYGIEHEVAFLNSKGEFADFTNTKFADFQNIVDALPYYESDYPQLRVGDAGIKVKRWYVEGYERFSEKGEVTDCVPKGIEIRTTLHSSIYAAVEELVQSMEILKEKAAQAGFHPIHLSFNPKNSVFKPDPPLNYYELKRRKESPEKQTADIPILTYGPDLSISLSTLSPKEVIDVGKKLTYYSPFIIPFSFSSSIVDGKPWEGGSYRTYVRTGKRPAAMVFLKNKEDLISSVPSLTKIARVQAEAGRIEFKAFDTPSDFNLYAALLALLKGLTLEKSLPGRALVPAEDLHKLSARKGFSNPTIYKEARNILIAAAAGLKDDTDLGLLEKLKKILEAARSTNKIFS